MPVYSMRSASFVSGYWFAGSRSSRLCHLLGRAFLVCLAFIALSLTASSQTLAPVWVLSTVAGNGTNADTGNGGLATMAEIAKGYQVATDKAGNVYFSEPTSDIIRKIDANGVISIFAGTQAKSGYAGDGGLATAALLNAPYGVTIDSNGNLLIGDEGNSVIRRVDQKGMITTVAGTAGKVGYTGDGGLAINAELHTPYSAISDRSGNIYVGDYANNVIRKVDLSGNITTFAGTGVAGYSGDGGPANKATLAGPYGFWFDTAGNMYFAEYTNSVIRMIDTSGNIHTFAGTGQLGSGGDGGPATSATFHFPHSPTGDGLGNLYIPDENNMTVRWVNASGTISTVAGAPTVAGFAGDGDPATTGKFDYPYGSAIDSSNNLYIADPSNFRIRRMSLNTVLPATAVGSSSSQNLFVESSSTVTPNKATVTPAASTEFTLGILSGCALGAQLSANTPCTVPATFKPTVPGLQTAQLTFADTNNVVSVIGLSGVGIAPETTFSVAAISTLAGNGTAGSTGAGGLATSAQVNAPRGGFIDSGGNIYFADGANNIVRRIDGVSGKISTVAGTGTSGYTGDGSAATSATLNAPAKVVADAAGDLYIADTGNSVIRYVDAATGNISTVAGTGAPGYTGDGGMATAAELNHPQGVAVDLGGHVYVADTGNNVIRYFGKGSLITTLTGTGTAGYLGDGGNALGAELNAPQAVTLDMYGDVYIADTGNDVVRLISAANQISTVAGQQGNAVNAGDGGAATAATLSQPSDVALDAAGDLYIAAGGQVRMVNSAGIIGTLAGTGAAGSYAGEGGSATSAVLPSPISNLILDGAGDIVLADTAGNRVLKVAASAPIPLNLGTQTPGTTGAAEIFSVQNVGNSTLNLSGVGASAGFVLQTAGATSCTATTTLAPGQACSINIAFSPASSVNGVVSGTLTLTDNSLNRSGVTQTMALSGTAKVIVSTTTSVSVVPSSPVYGAPASITATVNNGNTPTGQVSFSVNGTTIGSASLNNNQAVIALPSLPAGTTSILASYSGDSSNGSSSGTASVTIQPVVLTVTASNVSMVQGASLPSFTYSVSGFVNGDTSSVVTGSPIETTTSTSTSAAGTYPITLTQGTLSAANYTFTFVSGTLTIQPPPPPDYMLAATPSTLTVVSGQTGSTMLTLTPLNGYMGTVNLSCGNLPKNVICTFNTTSLTADGTGSTASTQLTISTNDHAYVASNGNNSPTKAPQTWMAIGLPMCFAGMTIYRNRRRRRWIGKLLGLFLLVALAIGTNGCTENLGSQLVGAGTYQITVTAVDASSKLTRPVTIMFTVQ